MKYSIIAAMLLVLAVPTIASADRIKDKDFKLTKSLRDMYTFCHKYGWPEGEGGNREATCDVYDVLQKVLEDKGYCVVGQAVVGQPGKLFKPDQRHCYTSRK